MGLVYEKNQGPHMETSLINPLIELGKAGNVLGSEPVTFSAIFCSKSSQWIRRKDCLGKKKITYLATSYRLKFFYLHLFLKGKTGFCEIIFSTKKVSTFCRKLELFIRKPNTCKPNISGWEYWFGVLLPHLLGGWQFGASLPCCLWGGLQPPHL